MAQDTVGENRYSYKREIGPWGGGEDVIIMYLIASPPCENLNYIAFRKTCSDSLAFLWNSQSLLLPCLALHRH